MRSKTFSKKILSRVVIIVVLATVAFGPLLFNVPLSHAQIGRGIEQIGPLLKWATAKVLPDPQTLVLGIAESAVYYIFFKPASWIMYIGSMVLDQSIALSINSGAFQQMVNNDSSAVNMGWKLARDIVNLFLIFILLYIAIATILQVSGYGAKELLFTLIIVAFMVNFSLVITKLIVDASNVLATGIYSSFPVGTTGSGAESANISALLEEGLDTRKILKVKFEEAEENNDMLVKSILAIGFGSVIMVVAGFIFFIFGILLLVRMIVLMILMIFAPFAFAAHILPSTKAHASKWWSALLNQAFFAPAVLFMLWIVVSMVSGSDSFIKTALMATGISETGEVDPETMFSHIGATEPPEDWGNIAFMINFLLIIILLIAALVIAKQMGAVGAQTAMAMGDKARKAVQGYAGRVATRAAISRPARLLTESKAGQWVARNVPLGGAAYRGMERAAKWGKLEEVTQRKAESQAKLGLSLAPQQQAAYIKGLGARSQEAMLSKMPDRQRAQMLEKGGVPAQQALNAYFNRLESKIGKEAVSEQKAKLGNSLSTEALRSDYFEKAGGDTQQKMFAEMSARDRVALLKALPAAFDITALKAGLSTKEKEEMEKTEKEIKRKEDVARLTLTATVGRDLVSALKALKPDEVKDLNGAEMVAAIRNPAKTDDIINNLSSAHALKILDRGDQVMNEFLNALVNIKTAAGTTIGSMNELSQELQSRGNLSLAAMVKNPALKYHLEARELPEKTPPPPPPRPQPPRPQPPQPQPPQPPPPQPQPPRPPPPPPPPPKPWEYPL